MVQRGLSSFRPTEVILTHERKFYETRSKADLKTQKLLQAYLYLWTRSVFMIWFETLPVLSVLSNAGYDRVKKQNNFKSPFTEL